MEGLKTELGSTRADNAQLRGQVRRLRRRRLLSAPAAAAGLVVGVLVAERVKALARALRDRLTRGGGKGGSGGGDAAPAEAAAAAAAAGGDSDD